MTQFWFAASTEEFLPPELVEQCRAAEDAGFDALGVSDHFAPWWPEGRASSAWVHLGAVGQVTTKPIGTGVTPIVHHYHPGVVAQTFMSLEALYPGRVWLGVGSGESVNEVPLGLDWPSPGEQIKRMDRGLEAITRLWDGETVTMDGGWFQLHEAKLYTRSETRPKLYVSAFGPKAAEVAGRYGDGLWTLPDPDSAPEVIDAYRESCAKSGRPEGEIIMQAGFHLADDEQQAIDGARHWKPTQLPEVYTKDIHNPAEKQRLAAEKVSDEEFAHEGFLIGADAGEHVERIRAMEGLGATVVCLQLVGIADPMGSIRRYGAEVLPQLRDP
jgi:coenzyme F420-dependent glucose-6-phosphate dehydrogenase